MSEQAKLEPSKNVKIAKINDEFRKKATTGLIRPQDRFVVTPSIIALEDEHRVELVKLVSEYSDFSEDNDPYGEHDFGVIRFNGEKYYWKIDYYDKTMTYLSDDPTDESKTNRVLTLMHSSEY